MIVVMGKSVKRSKTSAPKPRPTRFAMKAKGKGKKPKPQRVPKCAGGCDKIGPDQPPEVFALGQPVCAKCLNFQMVQIDGSLGQVASQTETLQNAVQVALGQAVQIVNGCNEHVTNVNQGLQR